jgi:hypothetical protein
MQPPKPVNRKRENKSQERELKLGIGEKENIP